MVVRPFTNTRRRCAVPDLYAHRRDRDGGATEPGTPEVYDRMAQMIVACCLAWQATGESKYLQWVHETLDRMEQTHLTKYPVGVNYGYVRAGDYQNTWCHLWGLRAFIAMARLW